MLAAARQRRGHEDRVSQGQDLDAKSRKGWKEALATSPAAAGEWLGRRGPQGDRNEEARQGINACRLTERY